ncbi:MAG: DUF4386 domain-containing protein [Proteobacteria bacterium]|nr:DUF4386 domain-containing protein [Pseudomonadota bacterium]
MATDEGKRVAKPQARLCGLLYLIVIAAGVFTEYFVLAHLIVRGDPGATLHNILTAQDLYRAGFIANLSDYSIYVAVTLLLFELMSPVDRRLSAAAAVYSVVGSAIMGAAAIAYMAPLLVGSDHAMASTLDATQLNSVVFIALKLRAYAYLIGLAFFGIHMVLVGALIARSTFLPRLVGVLLAAGGLCYLANSTLTALRPDIAAQISTYLLMPSVASETVLALWLLVAGVDHARWCAAQVTAGERS